eukprot:s3537_g5.t1
MELGGAAPSLPLYASDDDETVVEVFSSPAVEEISSSSSSEEPPEPVTSDMYAEWYTSLVQIHRARPHVPMRAINSIAGCLGLPQHDDQWCLGLGSPVAETPWGVSSSRWCLSGWILSREDQVRYRSALARREMIRAILLLGCRVRLPNEAMRAIFEWLYRVE